MTKKEQIEEIYIDALNNDEAPNVFADRILFLFGDSNSVCFHEPQYQSYNNKTKLQICDKCGAITN